MNLDVRTIASKPPAVVVVEDDRYLREELLVPELLHAGFAAIGVASALELYRVLTAQSFDLVLLDLGLPDEDGLRIAQHLRSLPAPVGIVMLTGYDSEHDRIRGLNAGADAYIAKPADMDLIVATLKNLARWAVPAAAAGAQSTGRSGGWRVDEGGWRILSPTDAEIRMTKFERQLIEALSAAAGKAVSREDLIARLAENVYDFDPHRLDMIVHRLRRKCLQRSGQEFPLLSVRNVGYVLAW
ncbi:response regulator transcription factor [Lysobacter sp. BMK333-48F3]|uniref:response regulator transcription factor n=1 Tax=Lysobacter sp. BMK333-48F3 TaxID=2867962 RepID=UPI001C8C8279|nr:response regulator transcription factor [Lysobacter sp. BMK333-48F3]MBX9403212.1 response regulator transcription factor [Lysobacter sp. BMK333-48F3]